MDASVAMVLRYAPQMWDGFLLTIFLSAVTIAVSTPFGFLVALARESRQPLLNWPAAVFVNVFRALPLLVILYFSFYGLPQLGFPLSPVTAALLGMILSSIAFMSEDMRSGLVGIDPGQYQAAAVLGLTRRHTIVRIILPQALRIMVAPYITRAIIIVKGTSLASIVAVSELTGTISGLVSMTYSAFNFLLVGAALYLLLNALLAALQGYIERRLSW